MSRKLKADFTTVFLEKDDKVIKRPLLCTKKQVKIYPVWMKEKYRYRQYLSDVNEWYEENEYEIEQFYNNLIKIFIKQKICFTQNTDVIYNDFVEFLYNNSN